MHKTIRDLLTLALEEDGAYNDITTLSTVAQDQQARLIAGSPLTRSSPMAHLYELVMCWHVLLALHRVGLLVKDLHTSLRVF